MTRESENDFVEETLVTKISSLQDYCHPKDLTMRITYTPGIVLWGLRSHLNVLVCVHSCLVRYFEWMIINLGVYLLNVLSLVRVGDFDFWSTRFKIFYFYLQISRQISQTYINLGQYLRLLCCNPILGGDTRLLDTATLPRFLRH